jgi:DNA-3-methyladenine glycosylase
LVRALEPVEGLDLMAARRHLPPTARGLTNGPGKLCQALGLARDHYGHDLCSDVLFLCEGPRGSVARSPRINIDYAGAWALRPWRFTERGNRFVSVPPR